MLGSGRPWLGPKHFRDCAVAAASGRSVGGSASQSAPGNGGGKEGGGSGPGASEAAAGKLASFRSRWQTLPGHSGRCREPGRACMGSWAWRKGRRQKTSRRPTGNWP